MTISGLRAAYLAARVSLDGRSVLTVGEVVGMIGGLEHAALGEVYAENERGGEARGVVAAVARALDVDIDAGPGHRWDVDHMGRVVDAARQLRVQNEQGAELRVRALRDLLRAEKERADAAIAREEVADAAAEQFEAERDEALEKLAARAAAQRVVFHTTAADVKSARPGSVWWTSTAEEHTHTDEELQRLAEHVAMRAPLDSLVSDLKNVIVSQAREIARLKGESE
jgi:hypothetical protein